MVIRLLPRTLALSGFLLLVVPGLTAVPQTQAEPEQVPCGDDLLGVALCPDLVVDPRKMRDAFLQTRTFIETSCSVIEGHTGPGTRDLLRFSFNTPNVGTGDLVVGRPADHPEWFEWGECHGHWHFREFADYRLWTPEGYLDWLALRAQHPLATPQEIFEAHPEILDAFVAGNKMGFCVIDLLPVVPGLPPRYTSCSNNQGIRVGWADEYVWSLDGQWIDVTGVPAGDYILEAEVNPERFFVELDYANNVGAIPFTLP